MGPGISMAIILRLIVHACAHVHVCTCTSTYMYVCVLLDTHVHACTCTCNSGMILVGVHEMHTKSILLAHHPLSSYSYSWSSTSHS